MQHNSALFFSSVNSSAGRPPNAAPTLSFRQRPSLFTQLEVLHFFRHNVWLHSLRLVSTSVVELLEFAEATSSLSGRKIPGFDESLPDFGTWLDMLHFTVSSVFIMEFYDPDGVFCRNHGALPRERKTHSHKPVNTTCTFIKYSSICGPSACLTRWMDEGVRDDKRLQGNVIQKFKINKLMEPIRTPPCKWSLI